MSKKIEKFLNYIGEYESQQTQLEATIICLENLIDWCGVCFNDDKEKEDYNKLLKALKLLKQVKNNYSEEV